MRVMQSGSHGADRDADHQGDLAVAQVVAVAEQDHLAMERAERGDGPLEIDPHEVIDRRLARGHLRRFDVGEEFPIPAPPPEPVDRPMAGGPEQPHPERSRIGQFADPPIDREPEFLIEVVGPVAHQTGQIATGRRAEPIEERGEGLLVAGLAADDQDPEPELATAPRKGGGQGVVVSSGIVSKGRVGAAESSLGQRATVCYEVSTLVVSPMPRPQHLLLFLAVFAPPLAAQRLADQALADTSFQWINRKAPGFRVHFAAGSYPAAHQDSLIARLAPAIAADRALINGPVRSEPIDVFFIASRDQMRRATGFGVTGFADPQGRGVFLVTNPGWRAFERHELMHVVAVDSWGRAAAGSDWLIEGLAQMADSRCGGHSNEAMMLGLVVRHGWIPLDTMLTAFRQQDDLRAYLQAAAFTAWFREHAGVVAVRTAWRRGATPATVLAGRSLADWWQAWRDGLDATSGVTGAELDRIETKGCG